VLVNKSGSWQAVEAALVEAAEVGVEASNGNNTVQLQYKEFHQCHPFLVASLGSLLPILTALDCAQ